MIGSAEAGKGYWGRILWVDLSAGKTAFEELDDTLYQKFLSGVGLGAKVLWDRLPAGADPLGPENILDVEALSDGFYQALGWDRETGRPSRERLIQLGLEEVVDVLYPQE